MFIVGMAGGLGNQMFEYAFYVALKRYYKSSIVKADVFKTNRPVHNGYELKEIFGINVLEASTKEIKQVSGLVPYDKWLSSYRNRVSLKLCEKCLTRKKYWTQSDYTEYYPEVFSFKDTESYYLFGVWANEKYFKDYADEIKSEFQFKNALDDRNKVVLQEILNTESVSIHIRRGDYHVYNANILSPKYYQAALAYLLNNGVCSPKIYVFSDDIKEAKKIVGDNYQVMFVDWNTGRNSYRDMQLMSCCRYNIIANSSFSFWSAYLNNNFNKIVIAPTVAFSKTTKVPFTAEGWISINERGMVVNAS